MITVITGAPCSGKSTYAQQHALPGDIVIDFDLIAAALGSPVTHGHEPHIAEVAVAAWTAAVARILTGHHGRRAWIVDTSPTAYRDRHYREAGARVLYLSADRAELHRRAEGARPPSWHNRIDQYLDQPGRQEPAARPRTAW